MTHNNDTVKPESITELFPLTMGKYAERVWGRDPMALGLIADNPTHHRHLPLIELELLHRQTIALETMARAQEVQADRLSALCEWLPSALGAFHSGIVGGFDKVETALEGIEQEVLGIGVGG